MSNFVAVACVDSGTLHQQIMWTEDDGATWTQATGISTTGQVNKIKYRHGIWMCGDSLGRIYTSLNGKAWMLRATLASGVYDLDYGNGNWIAVGSGQAYISADDGVTWSTLTLGVTWNQLPMGVVFGAANWVIGGGTSNASQPTLVTSTDDGATWTPTTLPNVSGQPMDTCEALVAANGIITSWGSVDNSPYSGSVAYSTDDGVTWTRLGTGLDSSDSWRSVHFTTDGATFLAAGRPFGPSHAADPQKSSTDGFTWATVSTPWNHEDWKDTTWDGVRFFMAGYADVAGINPTVLLTSTDLTTWTAFSIPTGASNGASAVGALADTADWTVGYLPIGGNGLVVPDPPTTLPTNETFGDGTTGGGNLFASAGGSHATGDVVFIAIMQDYTGGAQTITPPVDWVPLAVADDATHQWLWFGYHVLTGPGDTLWTFTTTGAATWQTLGFRNVDTAGWVYDAMRTTDGSTTADTPAIITGRAANAVYVGVVAAKTYTADPTHINPEQQATWTAPEPDSYFAEPSRDLIMGYKIGPSLGAPFHFTGRTWVRRDAVNGAADAGAYATDVQGSWVTASKTRTAPPMLNGAVRLGAYRSTQILNAQSIYMDNFSLLHGATQLLTSDEADFTSALSANWKDRLNGFGFFTISRAADPLAVNGQSMRLSAPFGNTTVPEQLILTRLIPAVGGDNYAFSMDLLRNYADTPAATFATTAEWASDAPPTTTMAALMFGT